MCLSLKRYRWVVTVLFSGGFSRHNETQSAFIDRFIIAVIAVVDVIAQSCLCAAWSCCWRLKVIDINDKFSIEIDWWGSCCLPWCINWFPKNASGGSQTSVRFGGCPLAEWNITNLLESPGTGFLKDYIHLSFLKYFIYYPWWIVEACNLVVLIVYCYNGSIIFFKGMCFILMINWNWDCIYRKYQN